LEDEDISEIKVFAWLLRRGVILTKDKLVTQIGFQWYQYSMDIIGHKLTPGGVMLVNWLCAPWDPSGGILQVFFYAGFEGKPNVIRMGECHVSTITWVI
jgi:hypothetical protein